MATYNISKPIRVGRVDSDPANPQDGVIYYNTSAGKFRMYEAGAWVESANLEELAATDGASLIGFDNTHTSFAATNVQDAIDELYDEIATAGATEFDEADFAVFQTGQPTRKVMFDLAALSAARDIIMPDTNVNLGQIAANLTHINNLVTLSGVALDATHLGTFTGTTIQDSRTVKQALQDLESALENLSSTIENFEWQESVISVELDSDNIVAPDPGDRYLIAGTGLNDFTGQDNDIAEWNGSAWIFTTPSLGTFVSADDESDKLYYFGGASWSAKNFEATTASQGLVKVGFDIRIADANTNGLNVTSGVFSVNVDNSTIERGAGAGNPLQIKDNGVSNAKFRQSAGLSVVARASNSTGNVADLTAANDGEVLRRNGTALEFAKLTDANIASAAAIDAAKIADGSVSNTEFQYINSLTSNAQTQLNAKLENIVEDLTPQLGGTLDPNGQAISGVVRRGASAANSVQDEYSDSLSLSASVSNTELAGLSFSRTSYRKVRVDYQLTEATTGNVRIGELHIVAPAAQNPEITDLYEEAGNNDLLVDWDVTLNSNTVEVRYTNGNANIKTMRADIKRFRA